MNLCHSANKLKLIPANNRINFLRQQSNLSRQLESLKPILKLK